jgi:hypothetical protein
MDHQEFTPAGRIESQAVASGRLFHAWNAGFTLGIFAKPMAISDPRSLSRL